jgi:hypothetical protein
MHRQCVGRFRVAARPVTFVVSTEVIVEDLAGQPYLLDWELTELSELSPPDLAALGTFFESSQDCTWHSLAELRAILCDTFPPTPAQTEGVAATLFSPDIDSFG